MPRASTPPPYCRSVQPWVRDRLKKATGDPYPLAALTGQDARAFRAFVHLVDLYGSSDDDGRRHAVHAMRHCLEAMQPSTRHIAKAAIPHVLDWSHEAEIWSQITGVVIVEAET